MIRELKKNGRSHAFDHYEVTWKEPNSQVSCLHSLQYLEAATNHLEVTSISWNSAGSIISCFYGRLGDKDWSTEKTYVCTWNLDCRGFNPNHPDVVIEVFGSVMCLAFHPSCPSIIAGGLYNGEVLVWDTSRADDPIIRRTWLSIDSHTDAVHQVRWLQDQPQGQRLQVLSVSSDGKILLWQMENDGRLVLIDGFALVTQQIPSITEINKPS
uniref:Uncharacterized protein n=2 Tax=Pyxicephalus adspersus TaxID=30357 RepID=A0AAV2ZSJ4_PYXAD|nr:TPA: hypothetical protein GDO54_018058 [Pyxicephalus adspersus]